MAMKGVLLFVAGADVARPVDMIIYTTFKYIYSISCTGASSYINNLL